MAKHSKRVRILAESVGKALRARRQELGLTMERVATHAGCHRSNVFAIEHAKQELKIGTLDALATALKCSSSKLLREAELIRARGPSLGAQS